MSRFTASAAVMFIGTPELWPPRAGRAVHSGSCHGTPGFWFVCGRPSMSEPSAMTGLPDPHDATQAVGMQPPRR